MIAIALVIVVVLTYRLGYVYGRRRGEVEGFRRGVARPTPEAKERTP